MISSLQINNSYTKFGGVIGRWHFFLNYLLTTLLMITFYVCSFIALMIHPMICSALMVLAFVPLVFHYSNIFRRVRDCRGTVKNDLLWRMLTFTLMMIPYVNLALLLVLFVIPGRVTKEIANDA